MALNCIPIGNGIESADGLVTTQVFCDNFYAT